MIVYLIAVSKYGDIVGSKLVSSLKKEVGMKVVGVGGPEMKKAGLNSSSDFFSSFNIISKQSTVKAHNEIVNDILSTEPKVVVTIDSWGFCSDIHRRIREKNLGIKQVHYIAPKMSGSDKNVIHGMINYLDFLITIFPGENKYFKDNGVDTKFVGYPIVERKADEKKLAVFRRNMNLSAKNNVITFLLGDNKKDIKRMLPSFLEVSRRMKDKNDELEFIITTTSKTYNQIFSIINKLKTKVKVVSEENIYDAVNLSSLVITGEKGVSLDLAINKIPHIVAYRPSFWAKLLSGKRKYFQLYTIVNDLLEKKLVPIFYDIDFTIDNIEKSAEEFLKNDNKYKEQIKGFDELKEILNNGGDASDNAAQEILSLVDREECVDGIRCIYEVGK